MVGGLAASAPIGYYDKRGWADHNVDAYTWIDIATRDYAEAHPQCLAAITAAKAAITAAPISAVVKAFGVCEPAGLGALSHPLPASCQLPAAGADARYQLPAARCGRLPAGPPG